MMPYTLYDPPASQSAVWPGGIPPAPLAGGLGIELPQIDWRQILILVAILVGFILLLRIIRKARGGPSPRAQTVTTVF
jgi:hypothetical protein